MPCGLHQGTKLDPWLFLVLINDLDSDHLANVWKYVDDTTAPRATEVVPRRSRIRLRNYLRRIESNLIATSVRSSLRVSFVKDEPRFAPIVV